MYLVEDKYLTTSINSFSSNIASAHLPTAMTFYKLSVPLLLSILNVMLSSTLAAPGNSKLFREYIGAENKGVTFSDIPTHSEVEVHFILSFAIDYTSSSHPSPNNGAFRVYWDKENLTPSHVKSIKAQCSNIKVAMSLGGDK